MPVFQSEFGFMPVFGILIFAAAAAGFVFAVVYLARRAKHEHDVSKMPQETASAHVTAKRTAVRGNPAYTVYYATFELESRARMELRLRGEQYGMLAEGDSGTLTYQGDRFLDIQRQ